MRALQNCARCLPTSSSSPTLSEKPKRAARKSASVGFAAAALFLRVPVRARSRGLNIHSFWQCEVGNVSVTGKVKFFNETKGYAYADLISDLAALG